MSRRWVSDFRSWHDITSQHDVARPIAMLLLLQTEETVWLRNSAGVDGRGGVGGWADGLEIAIAVESDRSEDGRQSPKATDHAVSSTADDDAWSWAFISIATSVSRISQLFDLRSSSRRRIASELPQTNLPKLLAHSPKLLLAKRGIDCPCLASILESVAAQHSSSPVGEGVLPLAGRR